jgi:uncharacterized membrane protein HdeD (DUF308 family)
MLDSTFLIIRGVVGIGFGLLALLWPGLTLILLVSLFAAFAFIDGVTNLILGVTSSRPGRSWAMVIEGLVGIAVGVAAFFWPGVTVLVLVLLIAAWAVATGVFELIAAIRLRRVITGEWLLALSGALSICFGIVAFALPAAGALAIAFVLGVFAIASGIAQLVLGVRLRSHRVVTA